jgi:hypothetical protein
MYMRLIVINFSCFIIFYCNFILFVNNKIITNFARDDYYSK